VLRGREGWGGREKVGKKGEGKNMKEEK